MPPRAAEGGTTNELPAIVKPRAGYPTIGFGSGQFTPLTLHRANLQLRCVEMECQLARSTAGEGPCNGEL